MGDMRELNKDEFVVGFDQAEDPNVMVFTIPLKKCADDMRAGTVQLRGEFEEAKALALRMVGLRRVRTAEAAKSNIIVPSPVVPKPSGNGHLEVL